MSLPRRLAFVDVETTGAQPLRDRITEIAVLRVEDGVLIERWQSLVNPEMHIPRMIQDITGIDDAMVAGAPRFEALADRIAALVEGCTFVAHNARFDLGFIQNAFARCGREFAAEVLCTVKLSRALYPEYHRHGLDALIERHGLQCASRHRAMGDAEALWQFVRQAQAAFEPEVLARATVRAMKVPQLPVTLPVGMLESVPDAPGVYLFFASPEASSPGEKPLFIGRSTTLRSRVNEHFHARTQAGKDAELQRATRRVEWQETAGDLASQLLELELRRRLRPTLNRAVDAVDGSFALRLLDGRKRAPIYRRVPIAGTDPATWEVLYGVFRNRREAEQVLRGLAGAYRLCLRRLGLENGTVGECSARSGGRRCAGVCVGRESAAEHDGRLAGALQALRLPAWPWPGAVVVAERHEASGREVFHLLDQWCHLGSAGTPGEVAELARRGVRAFDVDVWRILERWFAAPGQRVEALENFGAD